MSERGEWCGEGHDPNNGAMTRKPRAPEGKRPVALKRPCSIRSAWLVAPDGVGITNAEVIAMFTPTNQHPKAPVREPDPTPPPQKSPDPAPPPQRDPRPPEPLRRDPPPEKPPIKDPPRGPVPGEPPPIVDDPKRT
jgi:hypothetical protein